MTIMNSIYYISWYMYIRNRLLNSDGLGDPCTGVANVHVNPGLNPMLVGWNLTNFQTLACPVKHDRDTFPQAHINALDFVWCSEKCS